MGLTVKHVLKRPSGAITYRRAYPPELRPFLPGRELKIPIGHEGAPGLLSSWEEANARFDRNVAIARRKLEEAYDRLDPPMLAYLKETFFAGLLREDEEARWSSEGRSLYASVAADLATRGVKAHAPWQGREGQRWAAKKRDALLELLPRYRGQRAVGDLDQIEATWADDARQLVEAEGLVLDPRDRDPFRQLCKLLNDAMVEAGELMLQRLDGEDIPTPPEPLRPVEPLEVPASSAGLPLLATFDAYAVSRQMTPGVRLEWRNYVRHLIDFLGHDDASRLTAKDLRDWRDKLLSEPTKRGTKRDPVTVRDKYITSVRATLNWAVQEGKLAKNVAAEVKVTIPRKVKLRERDFTKEEALAILTATLKPLPPKLSPEHGRARRWIPWLCAYTGARVNEFSQLRGEDVRQIDGIWAVHITPAAGTVKAKAARTVPIHPHLIEQGFLEVVKAHGAGPLFYDPGRQRVQGEGNRHVKKVGERLGQWVREEVGITDPDLQPNHAWRHYFKTLTYTVSIEERLADAIQGHAPKTTGRGYGRPLLPELYAAICKLPHFEVVAD